MRVKALSGFWMDGQLIKAGKIVEVHDGLMRELVSSHKAEVVTDEPEPKSHAKHDEKSEHKKEK